MTLGARTTAWIISILGICTAAPSASAGPKDFVVYISRLGGDTETAKPYVAKFAAHLEKAMGWPKGSCTGAFFADKADALAYIKKTQPGFALLDPPLYFELRAADRLVPIAQLDGKELASARMHLVVLHPAWKSLGDVKGKKLWTTLADSPVYLSKVIFEGKADATKYFAVKRIGHALKGVRALLRGQTEITLIDDDQLSAAKTMQGGDKLRSIYTSPPLPPLPVVVFGGVFKGAEQKKLTSVLVKVCTTPEGSAICKEMRLTKIAPVQKDRFKKAQDLYERP
jgi:ABC-type phosphate/phosphonate transport system substrate-binding protein